jgi:carboxylesterase type B
MNHIAEHGGDPKRILVMGHSAGAATRRLDLHRRSLP